MPVIVTPAMLDAAYKWAESKSSMVGFVPEAQVKAAFSELFKLMYDTGYHGMVPVAPAVPSPAPKPAVLPVKPLS